ncbi:uncharacterized protein LOC122050924 [Zingiber officinale]|uniref:uncharacterized protein LOC122050924 n=1 Tax=Zingiber officinale TaxID=94328 RepID=UPI001C4C21C5|nr:uncharacterized protein LOC122050924 [Zingiber officinale]
MAMEVPLPEKEKKEEEDRTHNFDKDKYTKVVELIDETPPFNDDLTTRAFYDDLAKRVCQEARSNKAPLNLMNDSVLHEVIAREKNQKNPLAIAIIYLPEALNHQNKDGDTPLHIAAEMGRGAVAKALLEQDKELARNTNRKGETPLHKAVLHGHLDVFNIIIQAVGKEMATVRTNDGSNILHYAIMRKKTKDAWVIATQFPESIPTRNAYGATPLHLMVDLFEKPPETGILNSLLCKDRSSKKKKQRKPDEETGIIGCWTASQGRTSTVFGREKVLHHPSPKQSTGDGEDYEMKIMLLKLLVPSDVDDSSFYFGGTTAQRSISSNTAEHGELLAKFARELEEQELKEKEQKQLESSQSHGSVDADGNKRWELSPLITGIRLGIDEFVIKILKLSPWSATFVDYDGSNVIQAAVKHRRKLVVEAIKDNKLLPPWLFTALEPLTDNTVLHIAASYNSQNRKKELAGPLCLQDELEWFQTMNRIVPEGLSNYRNKKGKTAQELFDEEHEDMLEECRKQLKDIGRTCSPLLAAVVLTSSFYIPSEHNRDSNRLAFKIFSHVYVVGFSCAATSLAMFLMLAMTTFENQDFRRKLPRHYLVACFLLIISVAAFIAAFACNIYLQIYGENRKSPTDLATLLLELLLVPFLFALPFSFTGISRSVDTLKRFYK